MKIIVSHFSYVSVAAVAREFEDFGDLQSVRMYTEGRTSPFAIVEMPISDQAEDAIEKLNGSDFFGSRLRVKKAEW
jgi:RNA recognition motif-containing protein